MKTMNTTSLRHLRPEVWGFLARVPLKGKIRVDNTLGKMLRSTKSRDGKALMACVAAGLLHFVEHPDNDDAYVTREKPPESDLFNLNK